MKRRNETATAVKSLAGVRTGGLASSGESAFLTWARERMIPLETVTTDTHFADLEPLGQMIGNARIVALGEGVHCGAEPLLFRNRLLQYLVQHKGFTAVAIESGIVESRQIHDYVRGAPGDLDAVIAAGISWTFDQLPQNRALVQWLRSYNSNQRERDKVNFYGFDVSGSPANTQAARGHETALKEALRFLECVDSVSAAEFQARVRPFMDRMQLRFLSSEAPGYELLSPSERDTLSGTIADLIVLLERREARYTAASSPHDYLWGYRSAIGARQLDSWLRQLPHDWKPVEDGSDLPRQAIQYISAAADVRDRAQADNLQWIIDQEGPAGKVLVFAHRVHLSSTPAYWMPSGAACRQEVAGTYLRRRMGERLVTIANLLGSGEVRCGEYHQTLESQPSNSIDGVAAKLGAPLFLLDTRVAPKTVMDWLKREHRLAHSRYTYQVHVGTAFDLLLYCQTVTPACEPIPPCKAR